MHRTSTKVTRSTPRAVLEICVDFPDVRMKYVTNCSFTLSLFYSLQHSAATGPAMCYTYGSLSYFFYKNSKFIPGNNRSPETQTARKARTIHIYEPKMSEYVKRLLLPYFLISGTCCAVSVNPLALSLSLSYSLALSLVLLMMMNMK